MKLPLADIVIADMSRILAGPLCTMVLADLGADVIKIEQPPIGDDTRTWGPPFVNDDATYFLSINRNKKSIALDLADQRDLEIARRIIARADVLVENFRPGVMDKFGLGYSEVRVTHPGLVYCSIPAFSFDGYCKMGGYDLLMQAMSGFMSITGDPGSEPVKMGVALLDVITGLYAAIAILAGLRHRSLDGSGSHVEVGLFEASVASLVNQAANYLVGGIIPTVEGNAHPNIVPYQAFRAADGRFVLAAANDKLFRAVATVIQRSELTEDPRFATNPGRVRHREELIDELQRTFGKHSVDHWVELFVGAGIPAARIRNMKELFDSPEGASTLLDMADPAHGSFRAVASPIRYRDEKLDQARPPPVLGGDNDEVLKWLDTTEPRRSESQIERGPQGSE